MNTYEKQQLAQLRHKLKETENTLQTVIIAVIIAMIVLAVLAGT